MTPLDPHPAVRPRGLPGALLAALVLLGPGLEAAGQDLPLERPDLPREVAEAAVAFYNDSSTVRFPGRSRIPPGTVVSGSVASLGGPFVVGGVIEGSLLVINGDLRFEPGGRIEGDVFVLGGGILGLDGGNVSGSLQIYEIPLTYTFRGDGIAFVERGRRDGLSSPLGFGRSRFTVRAGRNYNRVEGLPVVFGPILETDARNPFRLEAMGVWRTETGIDLQAADLGYSVRVEQSLGGRDELGIGMSLRSEVVPLESWGLSDLEASLATFILHRDFRDYMEERGWTAFLEWRPLDLPLTLTGEFRDAEHVFAAPGGPWSLKDNDQPWRPQPAVAEGRFRSVGAALRVDTRNDIRAPTDGWLADVTFRRGLGGDLAYDALRRNDNAPDPDDPLLIEPGTRRAVDRSFAHALVDLRRYARVGPTSSLSLRGILTGSLDRTPLPPQFQHAAGGTGSLPGHQLFSVDCGARDGEVYRVRGSDPPPAAALETPVYAGYGCDRMVVLQAEFRGALPFDIPRDGPVGNVLGLLELAPGWSLFVDAARGWSNSRGEAAAGAFRGEHAGWRSDAGVGLSLGHLGAQVAFPFQGGGRSATFSIRLNQRF